MKKNSLILLTVAILMMFALLLACGGGGDDDASNTGRTDDDDVNPGDDDDDDTSGDDDDDDDTGGDDDDDSTFEGIERTVLSGGAIGYDGTSLQVAPDGTRYIAACWAGELYLFKNSDKAGWTSEKITDYARTADLVIDDSGKVHIVYDSWEGYRIRYATNKSGSWKTETVGKNTYVGGEPTMALDSNGKVHVTYRGIDGFDDLLKYATNESGSWQVTTIDDSIGTGLHPLIGIDEDDIVHIIYENYEFLNQIRYITNKTGSWVWELVYEQDFYGSKSAFFEKDGTVHVAFSAGADITAYTTNATGSWKDETFDTAKLDHSSGIAVDSAGKVHIIATADPEGIYYVTNTSGDWVVELIDDTTADATAVSFLMNNSGNGMFSYYDMELGTLNFEDGSGSSWANELVKDVPIYSGRGGFSIDSDNTQHIVWYRKTGEDVVYMNNAGKGFFVQEEFAGGTTNSDLAIDNQDYVHIGYSFTEDKANGVAYATNTTGDFVTETAHDGWAGWFLNIDTDSSGNAHMVFRDIDNDLPAYTTNATGSWVEENFDDWLLSYWTNLFVDSNDKVHVVYQKYVTPPFKYAVKNGSTWDDVIIDDETSKGCGSVIMLSDNTLVIAYKKNKSLMVAKGDGTSFTTEEITDQFDYDDYFSDMVKDDDDNVHIIFSNINTNLNYATDMDGTWKTYNIDSGAETGIQPQIAIDQNGKLHAVYLANGALVRSSFSPGLK